MYCQQQDILVICVDEFYNSWPVLMNQRIGAPLYIIIDDYVSLSVHASLTYRIQ